MTAHCTAPIHIDNPSSGQLDDRGLTHVIATTRGPVDTDGRGETAVRALAGIDVDFAHGERTATTGASGPGASTLMHRTAGWDRS